MATPPLIKRLTDVERRVSKTERDVTELREDHGGLAEMVADEAKLRAINDKQIKLLREADEIHARRLRTAARQLVQLQRRKR